MNGLIKDRFTSWLLKKRGINAVDFHAPSNWPRVDELPEADVSDLVQAYQYQNTVDKDFES